MKSSFNSMALVGAAMASVLVCYTVSLRVSAERAGVDVARSHIAGDLQDIRTLEAELRTRSRLPELQRWNEQVLALAPPRAEQFVGSTMMLASYAVPAPAAPAARATIQLASAVAHEAPRATMAAPSAVRQVAYVVPAAAPGDSAPAVHRRRPVAVAAASAPNPAGVPLVSRHHGLDLGVDSGLASALDAAAAQERAGFRQVAMR
ncbi:MAG: hypothetical protein ACRYG4_10895 [Janthinobacterium lividum]